MLIKALVTILICDMVCAMIAVPLMLRKVPRNVIYGFRVKATMENDFVWYEANAYFGRLLFISSFVSAILIILLYFSDIVSVENFINASIAVLVVPSFVAVLLTFRYIKSIK
jgi:hypothetical protein